MIINNRKDSYNNIVKRILSGSLAFVMTFSLASCKKNNVDESNVSSYTDEYLEDNYKYINDNTFFMNAKDYNEYNNEELNDIIEKIKNVEYEYFNSEFDNYKIKSMPRDEMNYIMKNIVYDSNINNSTYNWYINNHIDKKILYNKILKNNELEKIKLNDNIIKSINIFCNNIESVIDEIKKYNNNINMSIILKNIDEVTFGETDEMSCYSYYAYANDSIYVNNYLNELENSFNENICHEATHLVLNNLTKEDVEVQKNGCGIDCVQTNESPMSLRFMDEFFAEEIASKINNKENNKYIQEKYCIDFISYCTFKSEKDILSCYASGNQNKLIDCFEPELRNMDYVYSIMYAFDLFCEYGYFINDNDKYKLKEDFINYASINLIKNYYIRIIKELKIGNISQSEADNYISDLKDKINSNECLFDKQLLNDYIINLDEICFNLSKTR